MKTVRENHLRRRELERKEFAAHAKPAPRKEVDQTSARPVELVVRELVGPIASEQTPRRRVRTREHHEDFRILHAVLAHPVDEHRGVGDVLEAVLENPEIDRPAGRREWDDEEELRACSGSADAIDSRLVHLEANHVTRLGGEERKTAAAAKPDLAHGLSRERNVRDAKPVPQSTHFQRANPRIVVSPLLRIARVVVDAGTQRIEIPKRPAGSALGTIRTSADTVLRMQAEERRNGHRHWTNQTMLAYHEPGAQLSFCTRDRPVGVSVPFRFRTLVPAILALSAVSAAVQWSRRDEPIVANIDASYHVLLTVQALNETPASVHHFLPIATLGRELDRDVRFGAAVRGPSGIYYYTSFPSLGFVAPWAFFRITGLAPSIEHLLVFNVLIHLAATLLLALLVSETATSLGADRKTHAGLVVLTAATYLFTFEALQSHGIVYWHHSLFQVVWLTQLVMAARVFRCADDGKPARRRDVVVLLSASVIGPAVEWTGYLASIATAGLCWWRGRASSRDDLRQLGVWILACPMVAGIAFVAHFASVIGFGPLVAALTSRAGFRSTSHGSFVTLGRGYVESFGTLLIFVPAIVAISFASVRRRPANWIVAFALAATLPLVENVLLAQHAATYHFDRLKAMIPLVSVAAISIALLPSRLQQRVLLVWAALVCWSLNGLGRSRAIGVSPALSTNDELLRRVKAIARPCAIYATNVEPRGWVDFTLGANAYEAVPTIDSVASLVALRGACQGLYFRAARVAGQGMYVWQDVTAFDPRTGTIETIDWVADGYPRAPLPTVALQKTPVALTR